jgi:hypothetical protein
MSPFTRKECSFLAEASFTMILFTRVCPARENAAQLREQRVHVIRIPAKFAMPFNNTSQGGRNPAKYSEI